MKDVHKDLETKRFEKPSGVVSAKICSQSGKFATDKCKNTYYEYFVNGTVPKACEGHIELKICKDTGKIATEYCTNTETKYIHQNRKESKIQIGVQVQEVNIMFQLQLVTNIQNQW